MLKTDKQYVCTVCGYNMVGYLPDNCPFCGAPKEKFITSEECSTRFRVVETPVSGNVSRLNSTPGLGLEHAAYRINTEEGMFMIDCPSCFDNSIEHLDTILFTHFHFLGASNQYREHFSASVRIHDDDSRFSLCRGFIFDGTFSSDFKKSGIEAYHIDGHTPGFTCYFFEDVIFMCDYVFYGTGGMKFNPFGPRLETVEGGFQMRELLERRNISKVCGVDYVMDFEKWYDEFEGLLAKQE